MIRVIRVLFLHSFLICFAHIGSGIAQTAEAKNSTISEYGDKKAKTHAVARENYGAKVQFAAFSPNTDTLSENTNILQIETNNSKTAPILLAQVGSNEITINGVFEHAQTLTVDISQLADTNPNNYDYQWWRSIDNGATFAEIGGASGREYVVDSFGDFRITSPDNFAQVFVSVVHSPTSVGSRSQVTIYQPVVPQVELEYFYDNLYIEYLTDHPASTISVNIVSSNIATENPDYRFVIVNNGPWYTADPANIKNPVFALDRDTFSDRLLTILEGIPVAERGEIDRLSFRVDLGGVVDYLSGRSDIRVFGHEETLQRRGIGRIEVVGGGNIIEVGSVLQPYIDDVNGVDRNQSLDYNVIFIKDLGEGIRSRFRVLGSMRVPATRYNQPLPRYTLTIEDIRFIESPGGGVGLNALTRYRDGLGTFSTFTGLAGALTARVFNFDIDGVFNEGERLRANIETSELSDTTPDNYTYQWWRSIDNGESFTEINNATNQEYIVDLARDFIITSVTAQILVSIIHISTSIGQVSHPVTLIDSPGTERLEVVGGETILTVGSVLQPYLDDANGLDRGQTLRYLIGFVGTTPNLGAALIMRDFTVTTTIYNQPLPSYTLNVVDIESVASRVPGTNTDADIIVPRFEWRDALGNLNNEGRTSPNINDIVALTIGVSLDLNIRGVFEEGKTLTVDVSQLSVPDISAYTYQWWRSIDNGATFQEINNATGHEYTVDLSQDFDTSLHNNFIQVYVELNRIRDILKLSSPTLSHQLISGNLIDVEGVFEEGKTLTVRFSQVSDTDPNSYTYQWWRSIDNGATFQEINDATGHGYVVDSFRDFNISSSGNLAQVSVSVVHTATSIGLYSQITVYQPVTPQVELEYFYDNLYVEYVAGQPASDITVRVSSNISTDNLVYEFYFVVDQIPPVEQDRYIRLLRTQNSVIKLDVASFGDNIRNIIDILPESIRNGDGENLGFRVVLLGRDYLSGVEVTLEGHREDFQKPPSSRIETVNGERFVEVGDLLQPYIEDPNGISIGVEIDYSIHVGGISHAYSVIATASNQPLPTHTLIVEDIKFLELRGNRVSIVINNEWIDVVRNINRAGVGGSTLTLGVLNLDTVRELGDIEGEFREGRTITAAVASLADRDPNEYSYQWWRSIDNGITFERIVGATGHEYIVDGNEDFNITVASTFAQVYVVAEYRLPFQKITYTSPVLIYQPSLTANISLDYSNLYAEFNVGQPVSNITVRVIDPDVDTTDWTYNLIGLVSNNRRDIDGRYVLGRADPANPVFTLNRASGELENLFNSLSDGIRINGDGENLQLVVEVDTNDYLYGGVGENIIPWQQPGSARIEVVGGGNVVTVGSVLQPFLDDINGLDRGQTLSYHIAFSSKAIGESVTRKITITTTEYNQPLPTYTLNATDVETIASGSSPRVDLIPVIWRDGLGNINRSDGVFKTIISNLQVNINGVFEEGKTLTANISQFGNAPDDYTYQWWRSADGGATFGEIRGATGYEYVVDSFRDFNIVSQNTFARVFVVASHRVLPANHTSSTVIYQPVVAQVELEYVYDNLYVEYEPGQPASDISVRIINSNISTDNLRYTFVLGNNTQLTRLNTEPENPVFTLNRATFGTVLRTVIDSAGENFGFRVLVVGRDYLSGGFANIIGQIEPFQQPPKLRAEVVGGRNVIRIGSVLQLYFEDPNGNGIGIGEDMEYILTFGGRSRGFNFRTTELNQSLPPYTLQSTDITGLENGNGRLRFRITSDWRDGLGNINRNGIGKFDSLGFNPSVNNIDVVGVFEEGKTLTANISRLSDTNPNNYDYQWWRSIDNGSTFQEISGAMGREYVVDSLRDFNITSTGNLAQVFVVAVHTSTSAGERSQIMTYQEVDAQVEFEYDYDNLYVEYEPGQPASDISVRIINSNIATDDLEYHFRMVLTDTRSVGTFQILRDTPNTNPVFTLNRATFGNRIRDTINLRLASDLRINGDSRNFGFLVAVIGRDYLSGRGVTFVGDREDLQQAPSPRVEVVGGGDITVGSVLQPYYGDPNGIYIGSTVAYRVCFGNADTCNHSPPSFTTDRHNQPLPTYIVNISDIRALNSGDGKIHLGIISDWRDGLGNINRAGTSILDDAMSSSVIDGVFEEGKTLAVDVSELASVSLTAYTYQWRRSIDNGATFQEIPGATEHEYVVNSLRDFNITVAGVTAQVLVSVFNTSTSIGINVPSLIYQPISAANISLEYDNLYAEFRPGQPASDITVRLINSPIDPTVLTYNLIGLVNNTPRTPDERYALGSASPADPVFTLNRASGDLEELFNRLSEDNRINGSSEHLRLLVEVSTIDYLSGPRVVDEHIIPWQQPGTVRIEVVGDETIVTVGSVLQPFFDDINGLDRGQTLFYDITFSGSGPLREFSIIRQVTITTTEYNQQLPTYTLNATDGEKIESMSSPRVALGPIRIMWRDGLGNINSNRGVDKTIISNLSLSIEGIFEEGNTLTANISSFGNAPADYTYQWWRSIDNGSTFQEISGATGYEYVVDSLRDFNITSPGNPAQVYVVAERRGTAANYRSSILTYIGRPDNVYISLEYVYDNLYVELEEDAPFIPGTPGTIGTPGIEPHPDFPGSGRPGIPGTPSTRHRNALPVQPASDISVRIISNIATNDFKYEFMLSGRSGIHKVTTIIDPYTSPVFTLNRSVFGNHLIDYLLPFGGDILNGEGNAGFFVRVTGGRDYLSGEEVSQDGPIQKLQQEATQRIEVAGGGSVVGVGSTLYIYYEDPNGIHIYRGGWRRSSTTDIDRQQLRYAIRFLRDGRVGRGRPIDFRDALRKSNGIVVIAYNQQFPDYILPDDVIRLLENRQTERVGAVHLDFFESFSDGLSHSETLTQARTAEIMPLRVFHIDGVFEEGKTLTAGIDVLEHSVVEDSNPNNYTYQWWRSIDNGATFAEITLATEQEYVVDSLQDFNITVVSVTAQVLVSVIHTPTSRKFKTLPVIYEPVSITISLAYVYDNLHAEYITGQPASTIAVTIVNSNIPPNRFKYILRGLVNNNPSDVSLLEEFKLDEIFFPDDEFVLDKGTANGIDRMGALFDELSDDSRINGGGEHLRLVVDVEDFDYLSGQNIEVRSNIIPWQRTGAARVEIVGGKNVIGENIVGSGSVLDAIFDDINGVDVGTVLTYALTLQGSEGTIIRNSVITTSIYNQTLQLYTLTFDDFKELGEGEISMFFSFADWFDSLGNRNNGEELTGRYSRAPFIEVDGVFREGETLIADISRLPDTDPNNYTYQWQRSIDGGARFDLISNATLSTYIINATNHFNITDGTVAQIQLSATYTGTPTETYTSPVTIYSPVTATITSEYAYDNLHIAWNGQPLYSTVSLSISNSNFNKNDFEYIWRGRVNPGDTNTFGLVGLGRDPNIELRGSDIENFLGQADYSDIVRLTNNIFLVADIVVTDLLGGPIQTLRQPNLPLLQLGTVSIEVIGGGNRVLPGSRVRVMFDDINGVAGRNHYYENEEERVNDIELRWVIGDDKKETTEYTPREANRPSAAYTITIDDIARANSGNLAIAVTVYSTYEDSVVTLAGWVDLVGGFNGETSPIGSGELIEGGGREQYIASKVLQVQERPQVSGSLAIDGNYFAHDSELTVNISNFIISPDTGVLGYRWQRVATQNSVTVVDEAFIATGETLTLNRAEWGDDIDTRYDSVQVIAEYAYLFGTIQIATVTALIAQETTGGISIVGSPVREVGSRYTVVNHLTDANGGISLTMYQWQLATTSGVFKDITVGGASNSYTLRAEDMQGANPILRVMVKHADSLGYTNTEPLMQTIDIIVLEINGVFEEGKTLTANVERMPDTDPSNYTYEWQRSIDGGASFATISNAILETYIVDAAGDFNITTGITAQIRLLATHITTPGIHKSRAMIYSPVTATITSAYAYDNLYIAWNGQPLYSTVSLSIINSNFNTESSAYSIEYIWRGRVNPSDTDTIILSSSINPLFELRGSNIESFFGGVDYAKIVNSTNNIFLVADIVVTDLLGGPIQTVRQPDLPLLQLGTVSIEVVGGGNNVLPGSGVRVIFDDINGVAGRNHYYENEEERVNDIELRWVIGDEKETTEYTPSEPNEPSAAYTITRDDIARVSGGALAIGGIFTIIVTVYSTYEDSGVTLPGWVDLVGGYNGETSPIGSGELIEGGVREQYIASRVLRVGQPQVGGSLAIDGNYFAHDSELTVNVDRLTTSFPPGEEFPVPGYRWQRGAIQNSVIVFDDVPVIATERILTLNRDEWGDDIGTRYDSVRVILEGIYTYGTVQIASATARIAHEPTATISIDGSPVREAGARYTVVHNLTNNLTDLNGIPLITYQWQVVMSSGMTNIVNATNSVYVFRSEDMQGVDPKLRVSVLHIDTLGYATSFLRMIDIDVLGINGVFEDGKALTADVSRMSDTDPNNYTYEWQRSIDGGASFASISNATLETYIVDAVGDFGITTGIAAQIQLLATHNTTPGTHKSRAMIYSPVTAIITSSYDSDNLHIAWNGQPLYSTVSLNIINSNFADESFEYIWRGKVNPTDAATVSLSSRSINPLFELRGSNLENFLNQNYLNIISEPNRIFLIADIVVTDFLGGVKQTVRQPDLPLFQSGTVRIESTPLVYPGSEVQVVFDDKNGVAGPVLYYPTPNPIPDGVGATGESPNNITLRWNVSGKVIETYGSPDLPNMPSAPYTLTIDDIRKRTTGGDINIAVIVLNILRLADATNTDLFEGWIDLAGQPNSEALGGTTTYSARSVLNAPPLPQVLGSLTINGNDFTHGGILSANSVSITDDPGVGNAVYVWQSGRGGVYADTPIATGKTLTLNRDEWDITHDAARLLLGYRYNTSVTLQLATATVHIDQETRGDISVGGIIAPAVDNAITLTNNLTDDNDTQTITYQWSRGVSSVFTVIVVEATNSVYVLRADDAQVGEDFQLRASVLHTDSLGYTASYLTTVSVVLLGINGAIRNGETLTGDTAPFANVPYTYQWQRSLDGGTIYEDIASANSTVYVVTTTDFVGATATNPARVRIKLNDDNITLYSEELEHVLPNVVEATLLYDSLVVGTNATPGSALTVTIISSNLDNTTLSYTWQIIANNSATVTIGTNGSPTWALLDDVAPDNNFEFGDNNNHEIRVVASVFSEFGGVQTIVLASTAVERAGIISILADNGGVLYVGSKVRAELSDKNGVRAQPYTIEWTIGGVIKTVPWTPANVSVSVLTPEYTITHEDIENLMTVSIIAVRVLESGADGFLDSLGDRNEGLHPQITVTPFVPLEISLGVSEGAVSVFYVRRDTGVSQLTYQWSEGESGSFDNIDVATSSSYIPPLVYDASFGVSVRAAVGYTYNGIKTTILSAPLRVVGVASVAAQNNIAGDGLTIGATYTLELSGLRDPLGRVVDSSLLNYQWYRTGADGDSLINNAVNNNYILTTNVFNQTNTSLFVRVSDKSALHVGEIESSAANINDATIGTVGIDGSDYRPGGIFSVNTSDITDNNEGLTYSYQWQRNTTGGSYVNIADATLVAYTVLAADLSDSGVSPTLRLLLEATDAFGFVATLTAESAFVNSTLTGGINIVAAGYEDGDNVNLSHTITDANAGTVAIELSSIEWQQRSGDSGSFVAISGEAGLNYTIDRVDWASTSTPSGADMLRVVAEYIDPFGETTTLTASALEMNRPTNGAIVIDGSDYRPGGVFSANTLAITDANGGLTYSYQWQRNTTSGSYVNITGATLATYTVLEADFSGAGTSPTLRLSLLATDDIGFVTTLTAESEFVNNPVAGGININAEGYEHGDNVNLSHTITDENAGTVVISLSSIEWQWRAGDSGSFVAIAGETGLAYTIDREDWASTSSGADMLQVVAEYRDPFGDITTLTASALEINQQPSGAVVIDSLGGGGVEGSTLRVNASAITDGNGIGAFSNYEWSGGGTTFGNNTDLVLDGSSAALLADGGGITLALLFTDGLGFTESYTAEYRQLVVEISLNVNSDSVDSAVNDRNNISSGSYTYQWQESETASGSYEDIGSATNRNYAVPLEHDITKPYVRVEVSYVLTVGGGNVEATVYSSGIQALGISTGNVEVSGSGVIIGSTRAANIGGIEDLFGRAISENYLSYEWQTSDRVGSGYTGIVGSNTQDYTLVSSSFTGGRNYLRLHVESAIAGDGYSADSVGEDINREAGGALVIDGSDYRPGGVFSANTLAITDANGGIVYSYQWQQNTTGSSYANIVEATLATYTVSEVDFTGSGASPTLRVLVLATDPFGFVTTVTAESAFVNSQATGGINIVAAGYEDGDNVNLSHTITDANAGTVAIELSSIEWQQRAGDSGSFVAIAGETGLIYTIDRADWASTGSGADMLQAVAEYRDPFGDVITLTASVIEMNRPTDGGIVIESLGGGGVEGSTLRVNISAIHDDNGIGTFSGYSWSGDGNTFSGNTDLILDGNSAALLADGGGITLTLLFTDGLGFTESYTAEYRQLAVEISLNVNSDSVDSAVNDRNNISSGSYTYQWQESETASGSYEDIGSATNSNYAVPLEHDITKPYVRVEVSYVLTVGGGNVAATVYSSGIQALGISTGNVEVSGSGVIIGSTREANISGIEDLFGRAIPANYVTYQWETSDTLGSNYIAIANAGDTQSYTLASSDFTNNKNYLRLHVESAITGDGYSSDSVGEDINRAVTGVLVIDGSDYRPGGVFSANTSAITDVNGGLTYSYQWQRNTTGGNYADIAGATSASYTVLETDLSGAGTSPTLRLSVLATDDFGFVSTLTAESAFVNSPVAGGINIVAAGYEHGNNVNLSHTIADENAGTAAIELSSIEWQQRAGDSGSFVAIAGETGLTYTIDRADWASTSSGADMLQAVAEYRDPFGDITTLTAAVLEINQQPSGAVVIDSLGGGGVEGSTLRVNASAITDDNGIGAFSNYEWSGGGNTFGNNTDLVLDGSSAAILADGGGITLTLLFTDDLGFTRGYTVEYRQLAVEVSLNVNSDSVDSAVNDRNNISSGSYTYQWQESETASGSYEDIGSATNSNYAVPLEHDITKPYVRVEVSYVLTAGGSNVAATVYSSGIRALGISTGNIEVSDSGVIIGSTRAANIGGIEDLFGRAIPANYVTYQWETSDALGSNYIAIANGGNTQSYTLVSVDFANNKNYLRLHVESAIAGDGYSSDSTGEDINKPTSGTLRITLRIDVNNFAPGGVFSANTSEIRDTNGIGSYTYQWMRPDGSGDYELISGETSAVYTVKVSDFVSVEPDLRLEAVHTDAFGFVSTLMSGNTVSIQMDTSGSIEIDDSDGYKHGSILQINDDDIRDNNGTLTFVGAEWQRRAEGNGDFTPITGETSETYTINRAHWAASASGADMLRVVAEYEDPFEDVTTLTAAAIEINRPTEGDIQVVILGGGTQVIEGTTLSVDISDLSDENSGENGDYNISYEWSVNGTLSSPTTQIYIINPREAELVTRGQLVMSVTATYTDGLGFVATVSAGLQLTSFDSIKLKEIVALLGALPAHKATDAINKHLERISESKNAIDGESYLEINNVEMNGAEDITRALSNRTNDSLYKDNLFALDTFRTSYSKADESGDIWSSWIESSWSQLEGNPIVGDDVLEYSGKSFDVHAGVDKAFGDSARAGIAVGINKTELDVDFDESGTLDDKVTRDLNSILPYIEWRDDKLDAYLLFIGGYGIGKLELQQANNGCRSDLDVDWMMANLSGGYKVYLTEKMDLSFSGSGNITHSDVGAGLCDRGGRVDALDASGGESSLGVKTSWLEPLAYAKGSLHPYLSVDARMSYGDVEDKAVYDLGGGLKLSLPVQGVLFNVDVKRQINRSEHNRNSISGGLSFKYGSYETSLKSSYDISNGIGEFVHRWELGHISEWGVNTINSGIYVERTIGEYKTIDNVGVHLEMEWK